MLVIDGVFEAERPAKSLENLPGLHFWPGNFSWLFCFMFRIVSNRETPLLDWTWSQQFSKLFSKFEQFDLAKKGEMAVFSPLQNIWTPLCAPCCSNLINMANTLWSVPLYSESEPIVKFTAKKFRKMHKNSKEFNHWPRYLGYLISFGYESIILLRAPNWNLAF